MKIRHWTGKVFAEGITGAVALVAPVKSLCPLYTTCAETECRAMEAMRIGASERS